ncbi:MAG: GSCFA domain protein [Bacteroidetes bacterium]|nr:MAG: GSCFA domain protein [Bacteroidota bacterium]
MKLITELGLPEYPFRMDHHAPSLFMGSCFTENIGRLLERWKFPVNINPFGVTYNPASLGRQLEALMLKEAYVAEDLNQYKDRWFSFDHYTGFSSSDQQRCLEGINRSFLKAKKELQQASLLVITWGTSWVYQYKPTGSVVCNCHKIPSGQFTRSRLSVKEIINKYSDLLPQLFIHNPDLKILITVSPVRHWKDGAHGNQLSKASLLLASEALEQQFPGKVFYFPSYEITMDELRDYRYYADDMLHLNPLATRYIWEKFQSVLVSGESQQIINDLEPLIRMEEHRALEENGEAHENTLRKRDAKRLALQEKYSFLKL